MYNRLSQRSHAPAYYRLLIIHYTLKAMTTDWEKVMVTRQPHQAELAKAQLVENDIDAVIINKQSSSYPELFGNFEVYVPMKDAIIARIILDNETTIS